MPVVRIQQRCLPHVRTGGLHIWTASARHLTLRPTSAACACSSEEKSESEKLRVGLAEVQQRVEGALGGSLDEKISVHHVRDVAPNKVMLCVSFRISRSLLVRGSSEHHDAGQSCKRQKCASDAD